MATIYAGSTPIKRLGKHQYRLLTFLLFNPGWHYYNTKDRKVVASLIKRNLIAKSPKGQIKFDQNSNGYNNLIERVRSIDIKAAKYLEDNYDKVLLDARLLRCFVFSDTPQGHNYWQNIHNKLKELK